MDELETFVGSIKKLESFLIKFVLSSFAFSLLAVIAQYDKFDLAFQSLTELLGGIAGSAGILSGYIGRYTHPSEKVGDHLKFNPYIAGLRIVVSLILSAAMFYVFYQFASASNKLGLLFLCIGMFLFFNSLAVTIRTFEKTKLQQRIWETMPSEMREDWIESQKTLNEALYTLEHDPELKAAEAKFLNSLKKTEELQREFERAETRKKIQKIISWPWRASIGLRKRIGGQNLLTTRELRTEHTAVKLLDQLDHDTHTKNIDAIKQKKVRGNPLENTEIVLYRTGGSIYFIPKGDIDASSARRYIESLTSLKPDEAGKPNRFVAVLPPSITVTNEAFELLREASIALHEIDEEMAGEPS